MKLNVMAKEADAKNKADYNTSLNDDGNGPGHTTGGVGSSGSGSDSEGNLKIEKSPIDRGLANASEEIDEGKRKSTDDLETKHDRNIREKGFFDDIADRLPTEPPLLAIPSNAEPQLQRASTAGTDVENYPEGGLKAWSVVLGCWFSLVAASGLLNTLATFQAYLTTHQLSNYNESSIGWIFSLFTFVVFGVGLFTGPIFDKYGPRWIVAVGTIFDVLGLMLFSISTGKKSLAGTVQIRKLGKHSAYP